jgi:DnaA family protein
LIGHIDENGAEAGSVMGHPMEAKQIPLPSFFPVRATFDQFWPGANRQLVNHLQAIARGLSDAFLYLWGPAECGKSHLLQASCQAAHESGRSAFYLPARYVPTSEPALLDGLEDRQLVCIDDVEAMLGDPPLEQSLFRLFNALRESGNNLLIASTLPPADLPIRLPDLHSRMSWGVVYRMQGLNDEDTLAAIDLCAQELGLRLPDSVRSYLMIRCQRDFRFLRRLLVELDRASLTEQRALTVPLVKQVLAGIS